MTGYTVVEKMLSDRAEVAHATLAGFMDASCDIDLQTFVSNALAALGADAFPATVQAFAELARVVETTMAGNAYHAPSHAADVAASALYLAHVERGVGGDGFPSARQTLVLFAAALGHDCWHDGVGNTCPRTGRRVDFRLERLAARETASRMRRVFTPDECAQIETMILATEPAYRRQVGTLVDLAYEDATLTPEELDRLDVPAPLADIAADKDLARLCGLLADADLFPSTGFDYAQCVRQARRVEREIGLAESAVDETIREFLDVIVGPALLSRAGVTHARRRRAVSEAVGARVSDGPIANYPALVEGFTPPDWHVAQDPMRATLTRRMESVTVTKQGLRLTRREGRLMSIARAEPDGEVRIVRVPAATAPADRPRPKRPAGEGAELGRGSVRPPGLRGAHPLLSPTQALLPTG